MLWSLLALALAQPPPPGAEPLCPQGWESLREDACLLRGDRPGLIVYFHGMTPPSPRALGYELSFISRVPKQRRVSLVSLRGTPGLCDWADDVSGWWCWPTARVRSTELLDVVERLYDGVAAAKHRLSRDDGAPVIAGYSNGGYLVTMLMGDTTVPCAGWVVMHSGPVTGTTYSKERERPTLLLTGAADSVQRPAMDLLKQRLDEAHWSSVLVVRPGGHPPEVEDYQRLFDFGAMVSRKP
jgi:predicted esterase